MPQLRIGFLARDWTQVEPWVHRLIAKIHTDEQLEVCAFIESQTNVNQPKTNWLFSLLNPIESLIFGRAITAQDSNIRDLMTSHQVVPDREIAAISSQKLDVILNVDSGIIGPKIADLARHGTWGLDIFDQVGGLSALAAVKGREAVAQIGLYKYDKDGAARQYIANAAINPKFLLSRNLVFMKEKAAVLVLRELRRLSILGDVKVGSINKRPSHRALKTGDIVRYYGTALKKLANKGIWKFKRKAGFRSDQFVLLLGQGNALAFDPKKSIEMKPKASDFWADPFLWERDGKTYCFYEHFCGASLTGHIQVGEIQGDQMIVLGDALKTDIHLSFPFLFEHDDELYMMPETCAAKRIEIWRCTSFPLKWELHSIALEGEIAADSMILKHENKWWLFTNMATDVYADYCSELHIFQIDGPELNTITPHKFNPVSMDSRSARNAGRFHSIDGNLYRPSQDNAFGQYGFGLNIMKVEELSLDAYRETLVRRIDPKFDSNTIACHHFDANGDRFIIDAMRTN